MAGGKVTRHWIELDYNSSDALTADVIPYDNHTSIKDAISEGVSEGINTREIDVFELTFTDINNQYVLLTKDSIDEEIDLYVLGGTSQIYGQDYILILEGTIRKKITWSPSYCHLGMVDDLKVNDVIQITYTKKGL